MFGKNGIVRARSGESEVRRTRSRRGSGSCTPADHARVAVHMPWTKFREGESIPAYFVLRNNGGRIPSSPGFEPRFGPQGAHPRSRRAAATFDGPPPRRRASRCCRASASVIELRRAAFADRARQRVLRVPGRSAADGESCAPAGEYEVDWRKSTNSGPRRCRFTVEKRRTETGPALTRAVPESSSTNSRRGSSDASRKRLGDPFVWRRLFARTSTHSVPLAGALGVGQHGRLRSRPAHDPDRGQARRGVGRVEATTARATASRSR